MQEIEIDSERPLPADVQWRKWVARHPVGAAAIVGLVATQMATIVGYYLRAIGLPQVPWPLYNGALVAPKGDFGSPASFFVGQSIHMVDGIVLTILYVLLAHSKLPGKSDTVGNFVKGLIYGTILAIISMGFLVPYAYVPKSGYGFFSFYSPDGWKLPVSILLFHWVYGGLVGLLYNPAFRSDNR